MTLTEFLTARLDEDEAVARRAARTAGYDWTYPMPTVLRRKERSVEEHQERHDPARVLAEVEAQRTIIKRYRAVVTGARSQTAIDCYTNVLEDLATVYAEHPDYDEAWRP